MPKSQSTKEFEEYSQQLSTEGQKIPLISISSGTCSLARGAREVIEAFREEIQNHKDAMSLKITGCHGYCEAEPNIIVFPEGIFYQDVKPKDAPAMGLNVSQIGIWIFDLLIAFGVYFLAKRRIA